MKVEDSVQLSTFHISHLILAMLKREGLTALWKTLHEPNHSRTYLQRNQCFKGLNNKGAVETHPHKGQSLTSTHGVQVASSSGYPA